MNTHGLPGFLLLSLALAACGQETPAPLPPRPVLVMTIGAEDSQASESSTAMTAVIRSRTETALAFQVGGRITARQAVVGQRVEQNEILARLDPVDQSLNLATATAELEFAESEAARYRMLKNRNFVSQMALDAKESVLKAARARAALARNQQAYTTLKAEWPGVIASVEAEVGQVVAPGQTVFRLARPDAPEAAFDLPESRLARIKVGDAVAIVLWAEPGKVWPGRIREIGAVAHAVTRTYPVRAAIEVARPDDLAAFKLGMSATVRFQSEETGAFRLPAGAIFQQRDATGMRPAVWRVGPDRRVQLVPVTIRAWEEGRAQVIAEDHLKPGDVVVIAGAHKLMAEEQINPMFKASETETEGLKERNATFEVPDPDAVAPLPDGSP